MLISLPLFDCYHILLHVCTIPTDRVYKQLIVLHVHLCHQSVHAAMGRLWMYSPFISLDLLSLFSSLSLQSPIPEITFTLPSPSLCNPSIPSSACLLCHCPHHSSLLDTGSLSLQTDLTQSKTESTVWYIDSGWCREYCREWHQHFHNAHLAACDGQAPYGHLKSIQYISRPFNYVHTYAATTPNTHKCIIPALPLLISP